MTAAPPGRRERKKAATRRKIAEAALRLFLERGYDDVGIREVAAEADVAVTTLFSHFAGKEALVFAQDDEFERQLVRAVSERASDEPLVAALHREVAAMVRHCTGDRADPVRGLIDATPALREFEESMRRRHADSLAAALAAESDTAASPTACRALARFAVDAYSLALDAEDPEGAVDEVFRLIDAGWSAAFPSGAG